MADLTPSARQVQQGRQSLLGIQASRVLDLPESEYRSWVLKLERDPLFQYLHHPPKGTPRILRRRPWPHTRLAFSELTPDLAETTQAPAAPDPSSELRRILKKIGREAFEKYFLHNEEGLAAGAIGAACGLSPDEVAGVASFLNEWDIGAGPAPAPAPEPPSAGFNAVAALEVEDGSISIAFRSAHYARGLYVIDYDRLRELRERGGLPGAWSALKRLVGELELANRKQTALAGVLEYVVTEQKRFILDGHVADLKPLKQNEAAARLGVTAAAVSRALRGRSVRMPGGRETPLREFFPSRKWIMLHFVRAELERRPGLTDGELHRILRRERGLNVSVRSVNMYRHRVNKRRTREGR